MADLAASGSDQLAPERHAPIWLRQAMQRLEGATELDRPRGVLAGVAARLTSNPTLRDALRGESFGHAVHPLLTDYPLGAWVSVTVLDLCAAKRLRPAATVLTGFGVAAAVPTALSGLAEWATADAKSQRVGVAHGLINSGATVCYSASWVARVRGRHGRGVLLGLLGGCFAWVGGYLGGHLSLVRKIATADTAFQSGTAADHT